MYSVPKIEPAENAACMNDKRLSITIPFIDSERPSQAPKNSGKVFAILIDNLFERACDEEERNWASQKEAVSECSLVDAHDQDRSTSIRSVILSGFE